MWCHSELVSFVFKKEEDVTIWRNSGLVTQRSRQQKRTGLNVLTFFEFRNYRAFAKLFLWLFKAQRSLHTERDFIGTWTKDEENKAISTGYKILKVYEVWHCDKTRDDLFKGYI